jgi:hypothetical protein
MRDWRWFTRLRHYRFAIGLIAAIALLFGPLLTIAAATSDPLQDYLNAHLCGPSSTQQAPDVPSAPAEHQHDCQLCGPGCPMGGFTPVATLADGAVASDFSFLTAATAVRPSAVEPSPLSHYPSDALSQGPPRAA